MSGKTVPMERFRELVNTNEKHYGELTQLKADNTQLRKEVVELCRMVAAISPARSDAKFNHQLEEVRSKARALLDAVKGEVES